MLGISYRNLHVLHNRCERYVRSPSCWNVRCAYLKRVRQYITFWPVSIMLQIQNIFLFNVFPTTSAKHSKLRKAPCQDFLSLPPSSTAGFQLKIVKQVHKEAIRTYCQCFVLTSATSMSIFTGKQKIKKKHHLLSSVVHDFNWFMWDINELFL